MKAVKQITLEKTLQKSQQRFYEKWQCATSFLLSTQTKAHATSVAHNPTQIYKSTTHSTFRITLRRYTLVVTVSSSSELDSLSLRASC